MIHNLLWFAAGAFFAFILLLAFALCSVAKRADEVQWTISKNN